MNLRSLAAGVGTMLVLTALWVAHDFFQAYRQPQGFHISVDDRELVAYGRVLYVSHCAACHGVKLEGQPNWRERLPNGRLPAPPHDESGHTWHHSDTVLFDITRNGMASGRTAPPGYESDMPAYAGILTDEEIIAVLAYIKSTWPKEILALQQEVNESAWKQGDDRNTEAGRRQAE